MTSNTTQLIFELHKGQAQFAYFQLGVAASAMAFAIHETAGLSLSDAPWPLAVAVALWALSFALGCFGMDARQDGIQSNAAYLRAFGDLPDQLAGSEGAKVVGGAKDTVTKALRKPVTRFRWQKWALFAGALFYIGGHIMQMAAIPTKGAVVLGKPTAKVLPAQHHAVP
jgi:hypothetical protein